MIGNDYKKTTKTGRFFIIVSLKMMCVEINNHCFSWEEAPLFVMADVIFLQRDIAPRTIQ